ncbi:unnamed protein product [marine sediment metagenome]|uniref:Uncharacterized protein n=1 Tax=marine sediment metagenome TaxID=412755 RepID=X1THX2_9ZZZZ
MNWIWKDFKLVLPGLSVIRIFTGENLIEIALKVKEELEERQELNLAFSLNSFREFLRDLGKIDIKVIKKDFGSKSLKYDFSSESKVEFNFYFSKEKFLKFYQFLEDCKKQIEIQAREYKNLTEKEGNK